MLLLMLMMPLHGNYYPCCIKQKNSILTSIQTAYGDFKVVRVNFATSFVTANLSDFLMWYKTPNA